MAKQLPLTNLRLSLSEGGNAALWCDFEGVRLHLWLDNETLQPVRTQGPVPCVYKNPGLREDGQHKSRGDEGWFETRRLPVNKGSGAVLSAQMLAAVPALLPQAKAEHAEFLRVRNAVDAEQRLLNRAKEAGPELMALLEEMLFRFNGLREAAGHEESNLSVRTKALLKRIKDEA